MAGDCPHGAHLEATLKHCHDSGDPVIAATHETYLKIIDELKHDLNEMSLEVVKVQSECSGRGEALLNDGSSDITASLKELEIQNDRLQHALASESQLKNAAFAQLQTNNETLKCQINYLTKVLVERENHIIHLTAQRNQNPAAHLQACAPRAVAYNPAMRECCASNQRIADMEKRIETLSKELDKSQRQEHFLQSQTRTLNAELNESNRIKGDLVAKAHRLAGLLKNQEAHHLDLASRYESMERNFEDQAKKLREAHAQLAVLSERFQMMEKLQAENNMERNILRDEVIALKEKEAIVMGRQKSLQEQLLKTEKEVYAAHNVMKEQQTIMQKNENSHTAILKRLKDENTDVRRKLTNLLKDHKQLREDREKQNDVIKRYEQIFDSYRQWKNCQLANDAETRQQFQEYEKRIRLLQEEKNKCVTEFQKLFQEYTILEVELDRAQRNVYGREGNLLYPYLGSSLSERVITERLDHLREALLRFSEQATYLQATASPRERSQPQTQSDTGQGPGPAPKAEGKKTDESSKE